VIGDTTYDIEMARGAGARAIGVGWGYHPAASLMASGAETVLGHFDDLDSALDALMEETA
jgi:phosphoglycolate phosphatase